MKQITTTKPARPLPDLGNEMYHSEGFTFFQAVWRLRSHRQETRVTLPSPCQRHERTARDWTADYAPNAYLHSWESFTMTHCRMRSSSDRTLIILEALHEERQN